MYYQSLRKTAQFGKHNRASNTTLYCYKRKHKINILHKIILFSNAYKEFLRLGDCHAAIMTLHLSQRRQYLRYGKINYLKRQIKRRYLSIHIRRHARSGARSIKIDTFPKWLTEILLLHDLGFFAFF